MKTYLVCWSYRLTETWIWFLVFLKEHWTTWGNASLGCLVSCRAFWFCGIGLISPLLYLKTMARCFWWILFNLEGSRVPIISFENQNNASVNIFSKLCPMDWDQGPFCGDVSKTILFSASWYFCLWSHTNYTFLLKVYDFNLINHILEFLSQFIAQDESDWRLSHP